MDFLEELQDRVIPGDGAMGTELIAAGRSRTECLEELCVSQPELIAGIHERYIAAGAKVIRTNSFGANALRLAAHGCEHRVSEINWSAAQLAKDISKGKDVRVAGSVGPLGITAAEAKAKGLNRHEIFTEQIGALLDGGCRIILLETFQDVDELLIALHAKQSLHHCPAITSLSCDGQGLLPDGTTLAAAFARLRAADADIVGINCVSPQEALQALAEHGDPGPIAAFPHAGLPTTGADGRLSYPVGPEEFAAQTFALSKLGVNLLGGCCGAGPEHISALVKAAFPAPPV